MITRVVPPAILGGAGAGVDLWAKSGRSLGVVDLRLVFGVGLAGVCCCLALALRV